MSLFFLSTTNVHLFELAFVLYSSIIWFKHFFHNSLLSIASMFCWNIGAMFFIPIGSMLYSHLHDFIINIVFFLSPSFKGVC